MFPIGYFPIEKAVEFLSEGFNQPINYEGVVNIAANGGIRFCKHFDEPLCKFSVVKEPLTLEEFNEIDFIKKPAEYDPQTCFKETLRCEREYGFRGVISIPSESIKLLSERNKRDCEVITFTTIDQILEIERLHPKKYDPRLIEDGAWLGKKKINESRTRRDDKPEQGVFMVNLDELFVPIQDLLNFIKNNKNPEQPKQQTAVSAPENKTPPATTTDDNISEETLFALFDPVPVEALEKMFLADGQWKKWVEKAKRNGLICAREGRAKFNPYKAGTWFILKGAEGWDAARLYRVLSNNLPVRSLDKKYFLTGNIE